MKKKIALFIFCLLSGAYFFYVLREAVYSHPSKNRPLIITHLRSRMPIGYRDSLRLKEMTLENILRSQKK